MAYKTARRKAAKKTVNRARRRAVPARRRSARRMNAAKNDIGGAAMQLLTIGVATMATEMAKVELRKTITGSWMLNGGLTLVGLLGAGYSKPGVMRDIAMGVGISGVVGLGAEVMTAMDADGTPTPPLQGARGRNLTPAQTAKIVQRLKTAATTHRVNGIPATLNNANGIPATLNGYGYDGGVVGW
jgi:hypothetical protein